MLGGAERILAAAGVENSRYEAEALLAHCLGIERWRLILERNRVVAREEKDQLQGLLALRLARRPLAYLLGWVGFHDLVLKVDPRALIPRLETELLVEESIRFLAGISAPAVIEICCGSGAVALALARALPGGRVGGSDISGSALDLARENAVRLGLESRTDFREGDLFAPWSDYRGTADLIVANPPYLTRAELEQAPPEVRDHEPALALDGGVDGLDLIRRLVAGAPDYLRPGGRLLFEIGAGQGAAVGGLARPGGLELVELKKDYCGRDRVAVFGRDDGKH